jgi:hypothetical protein
MFSGTSERASRVRSNGHRISGDPQSPNLSVNANEVQRTSQDIPHYADMRLAGPMEVDRAGDIEEFPGCHNVLTVGDTAERLDERRLLPRRRFATKLIECHQASVKSASCAPLYVQAFHTGITPKPV